MMPFKRHDHFTNAVNLSVQSAGDSERLSNNGGFYSSGFVPEKKIFVRGNIRWPCRDHYFSSKSKASVWLKGGLLWKRKGLEMRERLWHSVMSEWASDGFVHNVFKCYFLKSEINNGNLDGFFAVICICHWNVIAASFLLIFFRICLHFNKFPQSVFVSVLLIMCVQTWSRVSLVGKGATLWSGHKKTPLKRVVLLLTRSLFVVNTT